MLDPSWNATLQMIHRCALGQYRSMAPDIPLAPSVWACSYCASEVDQLGPFAVYRTDVFHVACLDRYHGANPEIPLRYRIRADQRLVEDPPPTAHACDALTYGLGPTSWETPTRGDRITFTRLPRLTAPSAPLPTGYDAVP